MIYWTKRTEDGLLLVQATDLPFMPDGDGFEVDLGNIPYDEYEKNPDDFEIDGWKLVRK